MNLFFWIKMALLFLLRSKRTALALGVMIFFAIGILVFISAIAVGINDCMILNSTGLYAGHITGSHIPTTIARETFLEDGVSSVLQRFGIHGTLYHGVKSEVLTLIAVRPDQELKYTSLWKKIIRGRYIEDNQSEILVSDVTAKIFDLHPGKHISFRADSTVYSFIVSGIFKTGIDRFDNGLAFCPLSIISERPSNWDCAVFLKPGADMKRLMASYYLKGLKIPNLKTWKELMPDLTQLIELNRISMGFVMVLVLGVVSFGMACAFTIVIISNIREYGVMKAMGVTSGETAMLIFSEVILMNFIASFAGSLAGLVAVFITSKTGIDLSGFTSHNQYFVVSGLIIPRLTLFSLLLPSFLSISFCLLAAIWPTMIVIRQRPSDILRSI